MKAPQQIIDLAKRCLQDPWGDISLDDLNTRRENALYAIETYKREKKKYHYRIAEKAALEEWLKSIEA